MRVALNRVCQQKQAYRFSRTRVAMLGILATSFGMGCWSRVVGKDHHLHSGVVVRSTPPGADSYERYLTIRLELDRDNKNTDWVDLRNSVEILLMRFPKDPKIWTLSAEIAWKEGDIPSTQEALSQALKLVPNYQPALLIREKLHQASNRPKNSL